MQTLRQRTLLELAEAGCALMLCSLCVLSALGQTSSANQIQELAPNQTIDRELTGAETHRYKFDLKAGEFFQVRVEQKGIDVALNLLDANGKALATMGSPNGKQGPETLSYIAEKPAAFALEVKALDAKTEKGNYSIRREPSRKATAKDRRRVEVEQLFVAGMTARGVQGQAAAADKQLSAAKSGWEELGDRYMADLTVALMNQMAPELGAIFQELNNEVQAVTHTLQEGQRLSVKSKADSLSARAKLNEVLAKYHTLDAQLTDRALLEKITRSGTSSQQTLGYFRALQFFVRSGEAAALSAIAQTYSNLGEWQKDVDYLKLRLGVEQDRMKLLNDLNIFGANQKTYLLNVRSIEAATLVNIGSTLNSRLGLREQALPYFTQALDRFRALNQETQEPQLKRYEALTLQNIGLLHTKESNGRKSGIEFLSQAVEVYRGLPDAKSEVAGLLVSIGIQHSGGFEFEAAQKNWDAALKIYLELDDRYGEMSVLRWKGIMYFLLDDKAKIREAFNQVVAILQLPDFGELFKKHHRGFKPTAGFEVFNELADAHTEQVRLDLIGDAYERLEEYEKAIDYYQRSLAVARSLKESRDMRGELASIGFAYTKLEKWFAAHEYYLKALEISRNGGVKEEVANDLTDVGRTLMESGRPQDALVYQNEALALYQSVGIDGKHAFSPRYSALVNELGRSHHALANHRLAIFYGKQGVNLIQDERRRLRNFDLESQKGFLRKKEKHYRRLAEWLMNERRITEARQVLALLKEEEILSYLGGDPSDASKPQSRSELNQEERDALSRYNELAEKVTVLGTQFGKLQMLKTRGVKLTDEQDRTYQDLAVQISAASSGFQVFLGQLAEEFVQRSTTREDLNEKLALQSKLKSWGAGVVFLYTLVGDDRYRVILVTPDTQIDGRYEINATALNDKIEKFRAAVENPRLDPRPLGKELYDILIKPIERQLEGAGAKTLLWSLDGNLRLLPLAALWDGKEYFGQKYQNVTITLASRDNLSDPVSPAWRALALASSQAKTVELKELGRTRQIPFAALPGARAEVRSIVKSRQSPNGILAGLSLIDSEFNQAAVEAELLRDYKLVHIASHLDLDPDDAAKSFLLFGDGTVLTVAELRNNPGLEFRGVELLTLSACKTAVVGKDSSGREIEGFGYVAQQKGAKAILATLWSVADESTGLLMSEFYRLHQANPRLTKAAAVQLAQQKMIEGKLQPKLSLWSATPGTKSPGTKQERTSERVTSAGTTGAASQTPSFTYDPRKPYAHPYYWAPFILIGNWR